MLSPSILERSSSIRENVRLAALEYSILEERPAVAKQCMEDGVDVNAITPFSKVKPLELALGIDNEPIIRLLLEKGVETEGTNAGRSTALIDASKHGHLEHVKLLVEHGACLFACDDYGKTCLHVALEQNRHSVVAYLLRQDAYEWSVRTRDGICLLQRLILKDDAASISNLKHCEVDLNAACPDGTVLVFFALKRHKNEALKGLLRAGADPNIHDIDGYSALYEAVRLNNVDAARYLIEHGADFAMKNKGSLTPVALAILGKQVAMLRMMLDCGVNIEQNLSCGTTPLIAACVADFQYGVKLLLERGANLNACTRDAETCLLVALRFKWHSIVDYLLDQEVLEVNGIGRDGLSALHHAVLLNKVDWMRKLIQKQADVNIQNEKGEVPVFFAAKHGRVYLLGMLLKAGADPNICTNFRDFALHEAVKQGNVEAVKLLLIYGADRTRLNKCGMTPVVVAERLVPPPQYIIHCLRTYYVGKHKCGASRHAGDHVKDKKKKKKKKISDVEMEQSLCCPITFEMMKDPVIATDGHTYERKAIEKWIREKKTSPFTRQPLTSATLIPNLAIKHMIDQFADVDGNP